MFFSCHVCLLMDEKKGIFPCVLLKSKVHDLTVIHHMQSDFHLL